MAENYLPILLQIADSLTKIGLVGTLVIDIFFIHIHQKLIFLIVTHFHCYINNYSLCLFAANVFSNIISRKQYKPQG